MLEVPESNRSPLPNHPFFAREVSIARLRWYIHVHVRKFSRRKIFFNYGNLLKIISISAHFLEDTAARRVEFGRAP